MKTSRVLILVSFCFLLVGNIPVLAFVQTAQVDEDYENKTLVFSEFDYWIEDWPPQGKPVIRLWGHPFGHRKGDGYVINHKYYLKAEFSPQGTELTQFKVPSDLQMDLVIERVFRLKTGEYFGVGEVRIPYLGEQREVRLDLPRVQWRYEHYLLEPCVTADFSQGVFLLRYWNACNTRGPIAEGHVFVVTQTGMYSSCKSVLKASYSKPSIYYVNPGCPPTIYFYVGYVDGNRIILSHQAEGLRVE